jgi:hypothetical protein
MTADMKQLGIATAIILFGIIENSNSASWNAKRPASQSLFWSSLNCILGGSVYKMVKGFLDHCSFVKGECFERFPKASRQNYASRLHFLFQKFLKIFIEICGGLYFNARVSTGFHFFRRQTI